MDITLNEIRTFNAVVRAGSFTQAAKLLGVSQPAVTAQIRKLESRCEFPLLERFSKEVRPTSLGKQLHQLSCQYLDLDLAVASLLEPEVRSENFRLKVATASPLIFMPLMAAFKKQYPKALVQVIAGTTHECRQMIMEREADIGLFPMPNPPSGLSRLAFHCHGLTAILPKDHRHACAESVTAHDLIEDPLIAYKNNSFTQEYVKAVFSSAELNPRFEMMMSTSEHVSNAVVQGLGVGFALSDDIRPDHLYALVPVEGTDMDVTEHVVWLKTRSQQQGIREFVEMALTRRNID
ncbi:LysR family transcriptional regulator [Aliamphritea ceti]|uniref:LysR family transcriptional regulator n=1 Tax=Aliamphritea ceti TaxID=1524258 RepID=UPI0021C39DF3|nr:LysR family transcriptional regulator [Aliamphritea ceti]